MVLGTVRGFAQTLALGIVISMFTALVITRMIVYSMQRESGDEKFYAKKWKERKAGQFPQQESALFCHLSLAVIVVGFGVMGYHQIKGERYAELQSGVSGWYVLTNVAFHEDYSISEIESEIVPVIEEATGDSEVQTQKVKESNQIIIRTKALSLQQERH